MKPTQRFGLSILLVAAIALPAIAYEYPLSSTSLRNAYMLGNRKDEHTSEFLALYTQSLPMPQTGPHVSVISVETPYSQVVELGENALNPDIQGTEEELADKKFPFIVRVEIDLTDTYGPTAVNSAVLGQPIPSFERDFDIQLVQGKKIPAESSQVYLLYSDGAANILQISGAVIELQYDGDKIDPDDDATVKVHTPDDQEVEATFDLGHLR
ncbi:MAG TPA: hypothetical protein VN884_12105 [Candidatus Sulfotelmatobacter sp.]|jgi:hypothetical protein|nr:hypothetical protein [Candidatus Sulfotelmatobacter sp.]